MIRECRGKTVDCDGFCGNCWRTLNAFKPQTGGAPAKLLCLQKAVYCQYATIRGYCSVTACIMDKKKKENKDDT